MNKVGYNRVYIFYKENVFCKFASEYKVTSFSKFKYKFFKVKVICRESKGYG